MMTTVGRGRGNWGAKEAPAPLRKPGEVTRANSEEEDSILLELTNLDINDRCKCDAVEQQIRNYCDNREHLWKMTQKLYDSGLNDRMVGEKVVRIWTKLSKFEVNEVKLKSVIMSVAQKEFEEREDIRREDSKRFLNSIALLGGIFHYLTLPNGDPYTVLINPMIEYYQFLLQECSKEISYREDELELLTLQLNLNGTLLKKYAEESLTNLMLHIRRSLVGSYPSEKCHYWLLLILDLSSHGWNPQSFSSPLKDFYLEKIGKSFSKIKYNPLPLIQDEPKNSIKKVQIVENPTFVKKQEVETSRDSNNRFKDDGFDRNRRNWQDKNVEQQDRRKPPYWGHDDRFEKQDDSSGGYGNNNSFERGERRGGGGGARGAGNWRGRGGGGRDEWGGRGGGGRDEWGRGGGERDEWGGRGGGGRDEGGRGGRGRNEGGRGPRRDFRDTGKWNDHPPKDIPSGTDFHATEESWD